MRAVRIRKRLESHVVDLPELRPLVGKDVEIIVLEEEASVATANPAGPRAGSAKGMIRMAADFDAPLEDLRPYMDPEAGV